MADSDTVTVRHKFTQEEREIGKAAVPFFTNQDFEVVQDDNDSSAPAAEESE